MIVSDNMGFGGFDNCLTFSSFFTTLQNASVTDVHLDIKRSFDDLKKQLVADMTFSIEDLTGGQIMGLGQTGGKQIRNSHGHPSEDRYDRLPVLKTKENTARKRSKTSETQIKTKSGFLPAIDITGSKQRGPHPKKREHSDELVSSQARSRLSLGGSTSEEARGSVEPNQSAVSSSSVGPIQPVDGSQPILPALNMTESIKAQQAASPSYKQESTKDEARKNMEPNLTIGSASYLVKKYLVKNDKRSQDLNVNEPDRPPSSTAASYVIDPARNMIGSRTSPYTVAPGGMSGSPLASEGASKDSIKLPHAMYTKISRVGSTEKRGPQAKSNTELEKRGPLAKSNTELEKRGPLAKSNTEFVQKFNQMVKIELGHIDDLIAPKVSLSPISLPKNQSHLDSGLVLGTYASVSQKAVHGEVPKVKEHPYYPLHQADTSQAVRNSRRPSSKPSSGFHDTSSDLKSPVYFSENIKESGYKFPDEPAQDVVHNIQVSFFAGVTDEQSEHASPRIVEKNNLLDIPEPPVLTRFKDLSPKKKFRAVTNVLTLLDVEPGKKAKERKPLIFGMSPTAREKSSSKWRAGDTNTEAFGLTTSHMEVQSSSLTPSIRLERLKAGESSPQGLRSPRGDKSVCHLLLMTNTTHTL